VSEQTRSDATVSEVVAANVRVHTRLAEVYDTEEPHFRPENRAKVRQRLESLAASTERSRMLDVGCGTGFMLSLAADLFERIDGIDATPAMLAKVDLSPGNITVQQAYAETVPFEDATFDLVSAYSFLDHLEDHRPMLREACRVLRPGGRLYIDLIPNRQFWASIEQARSRALQDVLDPIVEREINEIVHHEEKLFEQFGIEPADWRNAEPAKSDGHGFDPVALAQDARDAGFSEVDVRHEWFLGQAAVMHGQSFELASSVDDHLRRLLPASEGLYKYLVLTAARP
jgi:ubiquinone/menaquinone biosynthesis C-methylase UbiE